MTKPTSSETPAPPTIKYLAVTFIGAFGLGLVLFFIFNSIRNTQIPTAEPINGNVAAYQGTVLEPPRELTNWTLTAVDGEPFSLSDLQGRYVVMSFGYTHCPDVCPTTLSNYKRIKRLLGDKAEEVAFVFISVDYKRDTPEVLGSYISQIDGEFIGLSSTPEILDTIASEYGLYYELYEDGIVDHTASTFLINPEGQLERIFSFGTEANIIADVLLQKLS